LALKLAQLCGHVLGTRFDPAHVNAAIAYAIECYWLREERFNEWQPGMPSRSGWTTIVQAQPAGIDRAIATARANGAVAQKPAVPSQDAAPIRTASDEKPMLRWPAAHPATDKEPVDLQKQNLDTRACGVHAAPSGESADQERTGVTDASPDAEDDRRVTLAEGEWTSYKVIMAQADKEVNLTELAVALDMSPKTLRKKIKRLKLKNRSSQLCKSVSPSNRKKGLRVMLHQAADDLHRVNELP
jgi:hypothetical protein